MRLFYAFLTVVAPVALAIPQGAWRGGKAYVSTKVLPVGDASCATGGVRTEAFQDLNANGLFEAPNEGPVVVDNTCNGADASQATFSLSKVPVGSSECPLGGLHYASWLEKDGVSGFGGSDQSIASRDVCNQVNEAGGKAAPTPIARPLATRIVKHVLDPVKDKSTCPDGGYLYEAWLSPYSSRTAYDSVVDSGYVSSVVCTKGKVVARANPIAPNDACGSASGVRVSFGDPDTGGIVGPDMKVCDFSPSASRSELVRVQAQAFTQPPTGSSCSGSGLRVTSCVAADAATACANAQALDLCAPTAASQACDVVPLIDDIYTVQCGSSGSFLVDGARNFTAPFCPIKTLPDDGASGLLYSFSCDDGAKYLYSTASTPPALTQIQPPSVGGPVLPDEASTPEQVDDFLKTLTPEQMARMGNTPRQVIMDVPEALLEADLTAVINWIRIKTTGVRLPFCWRDSFGRGVGEVPGRPADCPATYTNNGLTCGRGADTIDAPSILASCPAGYTNTGLSCFRPADSYSKPCNLDPCPGEYSNTLCTCFRPASTLGGETLTCPAGYSKSSITLRCIKDCPEGYTNTGETCFKPASTLGLDSMTCKAGEQLGNPNVGRCYPVGSTCGTGKEEDAGLCYDPCREGFHGIGPVCWQNCDTGWAECAAGCARTKTDCGLVVANQVLAPLIVAANLASLGLATPATAAAGTVARETLTIGSKVFSTSTRTGAALIKVVKMLQTVSPAGLAKDANILRRIWASNVGAPGASKYVKIYKSTKFAGKTTLQLWNVVDNFRTAYAEEFADQTSQEINDEIDRRFSPNIAQYIKMQWGSVMLEEMAESTNWEIAQTVLSVAAIVDITGVTGLVAAYTQPICQDLVAFPTITGAVNGVLE